MGKFAHIARIPVGDIVLAEVRWKVLGILLEGSTKNKTGVGMFVLVPRSPECYGKGFWSKIPE